MICYVVGCCMCFLQASFPIKERISLLNRHYSTFVAAWLLFNFSILPPITVGHYSNQRLVPAQLTIRLNRGARPRNTPDTSAQT
jgi:hypothetical protein